MGRKNPLLMNQKIAIATGTRADYGLLKPLINLIHNDKYTELQLIVTGSHLSKKHGMTVSEIEDDGYPISEKIKMFSYKDTPIAITKSVGQATIDFANVFKRLSPDIIIILGDRTELLAIASAALVLHIPIGHIHGGEITLGAIDENIRHAISKMAVLHFPTTEIYRQRLIKMGELPERVFNVGAPTLDTILNFDSIPREELSKNIDLDLKSPLFLYTFHPVTLEPGQSRQQCEATLTALENFPHATIVMTSPNADAEGNSIFKALETFAKARAEKVILVPSLGQRRYLSMMKIADVVIGNSSSGFLEAPHFGIPTVNIGSRQKGRITPKSVINCSNEVHNITDAIQLALTSDFREGISKMDNPYGNGTSAIQTLNIIKTIKLGIEFLKKPFYEPTS
jgi:GDP/UDP-N,N'-diacetylbacillosamine 2-epimerase (hydrolysing)